MIAKTLALTTAALVLLAADKPQDTVQKDLDKLQGTWKYISANHEGKNIPVEKLTSQEIVFTGDKAVWKDKGGSSETNVKLDPSRKPKTIDFVMNHQVVKQGLYEIDGDTLKLAFFVGRKGRPAEMVSSPLSDVGVFVLKRQKK